MTIKDSSKIILYILSILCIISIILSIINIFRKPKCPDFCKLPDSETQKLDGKLNNFQSFINENKDNIDKDLQEHKNSVEQKIQEQSVIQNDIKKSLENYITIDSLNERNYLSSTSIPNLENLQNYTTTKVLDEKFLQIDNNLKSYSLTADVESKFSTVNRDIEGIKSQYSLTTDVDSKFSTVNKDIGDIKSQYSSITSDVDSKFSTVNKDIGDIRSQYSSITSDVDSKFSTVNRDIGDIKIKFNDYYTKSQIDPKFDIVHSKIINSVDQFKQNLDSLIINKINPVNTDIRDINSKFAVVNQGIVGIDTKFNDYYTKSQIDPKFNDYYTKSQIDPKFNDYYTKSQIDPKFNNYYTKSEIDPKFNNYYTKSEIDPKFNDNKIQTDTKFNDYYTKSQTDTKFNDYYTKSQIDPKILNALPIGSVIESPIDLTSQGFLLCNGSEYNPSPRTELYNKLPLSGSAKYLPSMAWRSVKLPNGITITTKFYVKEK